MSRAVERLGGNVIPLRSVPTAPLRLISAFTDIGQGAGLATTSGARPFLAVITTGVLALGRLFMRANQRLFAAGDPAILLGIGRDLLTVVLTVAVVLADVVGYVVLAAAVVLILTARRGEGEKYEGLRVLR